MIYNGVCDICIFAYFLYAYCIFIHCNIQMEVIVKDKLSYTRNDKWDCTVTTFNMFGDILSDESAALGGSLGMLPSASLQLPAQQPHF